MDTLREDKNIIILPADKGRTTVVLNRKDYITKAKELLNDSTTYQKLQEDPTAILTKRINTMLNKLYKSKQLTKLEVWRMKAREGGIAKFYGLPKIHKDNIPLRPIVSLPGAPTYNLSKELWKRLRKLNQDSEHSINNAQQFLQRLTDIRVADDETMVSFDVTALYTSISFKVAHETIRNIIPNDKEQTLKKENLCDLLNLCLIT